MSTAQSTALALKAPLASPALTGTPTAPTAVDATSNTQIATTAFVHSLITALINASPATLDTLKELADAIGDDPNFATTVATSIATKLAKSSNLSDLTSAATARTNLGLGTMATEAATSYVPVGGGAYTGTVEFRSNITYFGPNGAVPGSGGNLRLRDDTGTPRMFLGFPGSNGATSLVLLDIVSGNTILTVTSAGAVQLNNLPTYASDAAAATGGLASKTVYKTSTGELRIKV